RSTPRRWPPGVTPCWTRLWRGSTASVEKAGGPLVDCGHLHLPSAREARFSGLSPGTHANRRHPRLGAGGALEKAGITSIWELSSMEQRPLRLGDIVDDYCPRER